MKRLSLPGRSLHMERLEERFPLSGESLIDSNLVTGVLNDPSVATVGSAATASLEDPAPLLNGPHWAQTRGIYLFNSASYHGVWAPRTWTLPQWETWLDTMQFLGLNHIQLPRAPWSERPGLTQFELDKEALWIDVLQSAKSRGMTTSLIFGTTWHGDLAQPWRILSPGNSPADPNWQTLISDYNYWANLYGQWVDEWVMGVEDPGGSPSSAGISYPFETQSPLGNPSRVTELVSLELAMRSAAQAVNPASRVVAETWGLQWWGLTPGYASHLNEFLANVPRLPGDVPLSTHALDDAITNTLQATGRDVDAWPFFLMDHEFPNGHTKLHFGWTQSYLQKIRNQGIDDVVAHITHPTEQLASLYIYARLLEDTSLSKLTLLNEFAALLVSDVPDQSSLANAISQLGLFWDSVSSIANWDAASLQPVNASAPYSPRYNATQLGYLNSAKSAIDAVDTPRATSLIPMQVSPATWITMLRDQIHVLHDAAYMGNLVSASSSYMNNNYPAISALAEPLTRAAADAIVEAYLNAGSAGAINRMNDYLSQFWSVTTGQNHPLGIIYDFLRTTIPTTTAGVTTIAGDYLEYDAPAFPALFKLLDGRVEETDASFSYQQNANWVVDTSSVGFSGGSAMRSSTSNNEVNIIFSGTGVSLVHSLWNQGAVASWSIDGGLSGTGTINMNAASRQDQVQTFLAAGLPQTLHVLTIKKSGGPGANSILVDGVIVENNNRLRREDSREMISYAGPWASTTDGTPSGGSWQYTTSNTATITIPFTGTAVSIAATTRADYGVVGWSIDGGAGGTGTVNLAHAHNTSRKPFILSTGLVNGAHTLVLTKQSGFLINLDAVDVASETAFPDSPDFDIDGDVDGRDFLAWQRGFGLTAPSGTRSQGDADNDHDVDAADLAIWQAGYGQAPLASSMAATIAADRGETDDDISYDRLIDLVMALSLDNDLLDESTAVMRRAEYFPTTEEIDHALVVALNSRRDDNPLSVPRRGIRDRAEFPFELSLEEFPISIVVRPQFS